MTLNARRRHADCYEAAVGNIGRRWLELRLLGVLAVIGLPRPYCSCATDRFLIIWSGTGSVEGLGVN